MRITMFPTGESAEPVGGGPCRVWRGVTGKGNPVMVLVNAVGAEAGHADAVEEIKAELTELGGDAPESPRTLGEDVGRHFAAVEALLAEHERHCEEPGCSVRVGTAAVLMIALGLSRREMKAACRLTERGPGL